MARGMQPECHDSGGAGELVRPDDRERCMGHRPTPRTQTGSVGHQNRARPAIAGPFPAAQTVQRNAGKNGTRT